MSGLGPWPDAYEVEDEQRAQEEAEQRCPVCKANWLLCRCDEGAAIIRHPGEEYLDALKRREPERKQAEAERTERLAAERVDARKGAQDG